MTLWFFIAVLTGLGVLSILVPLARPRRGGAVRAEEAVYRDQLEQIERDRGQGLIAAGEMEAARAEIARRLLSAAGAHDAAASDATARGRRRATALAALIGVPALALPLYLGLGSPDLPAQPLAARLQRAPDAQDMGLLVAQVERHLATRPEDGQGWEVLAPVYLQLGRSGDAARAYAAAIRLLGDSGGRSAGLGEALVREAQGVVTEPAREAFERARAQAPDAAQPRFYLALKRAQKGDVAGAASEWRSLLADAPANAPWRAVVSERVAWADAQLGATPSGPGADEIRAAEGMDPEARRTFIEGMVARLAARLEGGEKDLEGWLRLVRAYGVMGETAKADAALGEARRLFADDPASLARLEALGAGTGVANR